MRRWLAAVLPLLLLGGDLQRELVVDGAPFPNTIAVLVDKSASMYIEGRDAIATANALWVAAQAGDGSRIRFATFGTKIDGWYPAVGYIKLPDADALGRAREWLRASANGGGTDIPVAVVMALAACQESPLGLVVVTDGDPEGDPAENAALIAAANANRQAVIGVITVKADHGGEGMASDVARRSGGPYIRVVKKRP